MVEKKPICEAKKDYGRGNAVKESRHGTSCGNTEYSKVNVHSIPRPWLYPTEPVVRKIDHWFDVVTIDPAVNEVAIDFPNQDAVEEYAKVNQE